MSIKFEGSKEHYHPKPDDEVKCVTHNLTVRWGDLDAIQRLAVEEGIDTNETLPCLLAPNNQADKLGTIRAGMV